MKKVSEATKLHPVMIPLFVLMGIGLFGFAISVGMQDKGAETGQQVTSAGTPAAIKPHPEAVAAFGAYLGSITRDMPPPFPLERCPEPDQETLERIHEAQRLVAAQANLPGAWRWPEVKKVVAEFGVSIPVRLPAEVEAASPVAMGFESRVGMLWVWPKTLKHSPIPWVAARLVHEATHKVVLDKTLERSGFTTEELSALAWNCGEFSYNWNFATEALAFMNQARATDASAVSWTPATPADWVETMKMANGTASGDPASRVAFAAYIRNYAGSHLLSEYDTLSGAAGQAKCMPFPIIRGPHRGEPFIPASVAIEVLTPMVASLSDSVIN